MINKKSRLVFSIFIILSVAAAYVCLTNYGYLMQGEFNSISELLQGLQINYLYLVMVISLACLCLLPMYLSFKEWASFGAYLFGLRKYHYLLTNLVKKDITTKYRRSVLGMVWSVLNPLLMMLVITAVFQRLFRFSVENFPLYFLTGSILFSFVSDATMGSMTSILSASALIKKVYIPKYIFPVEKCLFSLVNLLFSMVAVIIMFIVLRIKPPITIFMAPLPIFYALIFSVGLGMILATANVFFRDIGHLYSVWITAWMYMTPIIYPEDILPDAVMVFVRFNPLYHYVRYFRTVMLYGQMPSLQMNLICAFFSLVFLVVGLLTFKQNQDKFILHI